jgi:hypothetical protein
MAYRPLINMATVSDGGPVQDNASSSIRRIVSKEMVDGELIEGVSLFGGVAPVSGVSPELLLHLDDNLTDSSGNSHTCTGTSLGAYATSGAGTADGTVGSGMGFDNATTLALTSHIDFPDLSLGTGDLTIEYWAAQTNLSSGSNYTFSFGNDVLYFRCYNGGGGANGDKAFLKDVSGGSTKVLYWYDVTSGGAGNWYKSDAGVAGATWRHFALTRKDIGGGQSQWDLFFSGKKCTPQAIISDGTPLGAWTPSDLTGLTGRIGKPLHTYYGMPGNIDEFAVFKSIKYTGATYAVPTAPYSVSAASSDPVPRTNRIRHKLGRKAKGAMVVKRSGTSDIQVLSSNSANEISISSTNDVKVSLWVF